MKTRLQRFLIAAAAVLSCWTIQLPTQAAQSNIVDAATMSLDAIMRIRAQRIPQSLLSKAEGIAIIPQVVKAGFVVGVRHGRGVVLVRDELGSWRPPVFVTLKGGSVGWQAGLQSTDVILVFKNRSSLVGLEHRKLTIGVDAAAAAGPVGRQAAAATDGRLKAEVYSYSRSRGLFAGVSLDGSMLQVDPFATQSFYQGAKVTIDGGPLSEDFLLPPSAARLMERLARYSGAPETSAPLASRNSVVIEESADAPVPVGDQDVDSARAMLADAARDLQSIVDDNWRSYLALPNEVHDGGAHPSVATLNQALGRYDKIAQDPRYRSLTETVEFEHVHGLLADYISLVTSPNASLLPLPPPPYEPLELLPH